MTIKLLTDWPYKRADNAGYITMPAGSVVGVFDAGTEAAMIVSKVAEASALAATWVPPSEAPIYTGLTAEAAAAVQAGFDGGITPRRKRPMLPKNLSLETTVFGENLTGGTISQSQSAFGTRSAILTSTATTARVFLSRTTTACVVGKHYRVRILVSGVSIAPSLPQTNWFGVGATHSVFSVSMASGYKNSTLYPITNGYHEFTFTAAATSVEVRVGFGCTGNATVTAGDTFTISELVIYEVSALTNTQVMPWYFAQFGGAVGYDAAPTNRLPGSCVLCCGDSWTNDSADWAGVLQLNLTREILFSATGGHVLAQILASLQAKFGDTSFLYPPSRNVPGVLVAQGGINDVITDASYETMVRDASLIWDEGLSRSMRVLVVLPVLASNSSYYTAERAAVYDRFCQFAANSGLPYIDSRTIFLTAGAANETNLLSETGQWIHPSAAGHAALAAAVELALIEIDKLAAVGLAAVWAG